MSVITINDGTTSVDVELEAASKIRLKRSPVAGGSEIVRFLDGSAIKQSNRPTPKMRFSLECTGWKPPGIDGIDYRANITLTVPDYDDVSGKKSYAVLAVSEPSYDWDVYAANWTWTIEFEEY